MCVCRTSRERVRTEIFKGTEVKGAHRSGSEGAALTILGYAGLAYALYTWDATPLTGFLLGQYLGLGQPLSRSVFLILMMSADTVVSSS